MGVAKRRFRKHAVAHTQGTNSTGPVVYILEASRFIAFSAHILYYISITVLVILFEWEASFPEFAYWCLASNLTFRMVL